MPLPVVVDASLVLSDTNHYNGPFISDAGAVYVVGSISSSLSVHKASDPEVSWSQIGTQSLGGTPSSIYVTKVSDVLHCFIQRSGVVVSYAAFNMATDTWSVTLETIDSLFTHSGAPYAVSGVVRSDGTVVAFYRSAQETVMGTNYQRVSYKVRSVLGIWDVIATSVSGTGAQVNYYNAMAILGLSDRVHFAYKDHTNNDLIHRSLSSAGALDTAAVLDTTTHTALQIVGVGLYEATADLVRVAYVDSTQEGSIRQFASAANPTGGLITDIAGFIDNATAGPPLVLLKDARYAVAHNYSVYISNSSQEVRVRRNRGFGWLNQPEIVLHADVLSQRISANIFMRGGVQRLAYVYQSSDTVRYDELNIDPSDVPVIPRRRRWRPLLVR